ncbi:glycosyltransferase family 4 protein [Crystallibacter crystallopoietes]|uniref:glycosyltransferase family 4 protein n=1 Tax=Crystallibacter crystallopoietes TaxID=37928 RepID=UPI0012374D9B|nr:glycosyltransferase family 4 protein [Arthrobacter crystallopoietes]
MYRSKILVVARSTTAHHLAGGMESAYEGVVAALKEHGFRVSLLTTSGYDRAALPSGYENVWEITSHRPGRYSFKWWLNTFRSRAEWMRWQPDLIFSVSSSAGGMALIRDRSIPVIAQSHGTAWAEICSSLVTIRPREWIKIPLNLSRIPRELLTYHTCNKVVAIGSAVEAQLSGNPNHVSRNRITTIPNGVDINRWSFDAEARMRVRAHYGIHNKSCVGIFSGRLHPQKGADIVLAAMARSCQPVDSQLFICGEGPQRSLLERRVKELHLEGRVHFTGRLPSSSLREVMSASDVLLFPTRRREGLPLSLLEASSNGLPIITVPNANVPDEFGDQAVIVNGTSDALARAWSAVRIEENRESKLPYLFSTEGSHRSYIDLFQHSLKG